LARRTFNVVDITEILVHWHAGRSISEIARSLGVDRNTVRKYTAAAQEAGMQPGDQPLGATRWAELVREWFPHLVSTELQHPRFAEIAPYHELIGEMLKTNTVTTVHQRLRDERGLGVSITTFRRYVWATMPNHQANRARVTVRKDDPPPGQEAQIDYGYLGQWIDPATGRIRRVWAFVMVLSASRHLFVRPVLAMTLAAWIQAHVLALGFFGGAPRRLVTDNLKASVVRPDLYDPKLNRTYAELASHYGMLIDPARARKPKDKPRVERPIPYVRDSFFAGRDFPSLEAMQQAAVTWSLKVAGRRACRPLGGAQPLAVFQATERPVLLVLPAEPYELAVWATPKVAADCHISVDGALYSVPWRLVGRRVDVRSTPRLVEVFVDGELVKTHVRAQRGRRHTDWGDYPPEKVAFLEKTPAWCRQRAHDAGPHVGQLVTELLAGPAGHAQHHLRAAQGVLRLGEHHGAARLDAACHRALAAGDASYRTVKGILAAGLEAVPLPAETTAGTSATVPALLRGPAALVDGMPTITTATLHLGDHHADPGPAHEHGHHDGEGVAR
jgi:transposase